MRTLHIIMPMAGEGSRFVKEGYTQPKPLIEYQGIPLFMRAVNSLNDIHVPRKYSFIVRKEHITTHHIDLLIKEKIPEAQIYTVDKTTRGAVETCLIAEAGIAKDDAILVMDCDLEFHSSNYDEIIRNIINDPANSTEGVVLSFTSDDPRYSYALTSGDFVIRTAEKEVISNHALIGSYFFSKSGSFLQAAHSLLDDANHNKPEFYVSLLYNYLIQQNKEIRLSVCDQYSSYGTPEELNKMLNQTK